MTLFEKFKQDKSTVIAMNALIQEFANLFPISFEGALSEQCAQAKVSRSYIYERKTFLRRVFSEVELASPGRPVSPTSEESFDLERKELELKIAVLQYRLDNPGAMVERQHYQDCSPQFRRFILRLKDSWEGSVEVFCRQIGVPYSSFITWEKDEPIPDRESRMGPSETCLPQSASEDCYQIIFDYEQWQGKVRDFICFEVAQLNIARNAIQKVLVISGVLSVKSVKSPRYRGSTEKLSPGSMLVTDGKQVDLFLTGSITNEHYNWQAMIDQTTVCHTASVISKTECAQGVKQAFENSRELMGRRPLALLHDNKKIHDEKELRDVVEPDTMMIPATLGRAQNKADIEGEFGKWEQFVGTIVLDDTNMETLKQSAVSEVVRAYVSATNHAQRFELDGKSRMRVLKNACPNQDKDLKFLRKLHAEHKNRFKSTPLHTQPIARRLLDHGFKEYGLLDSDKQGKLRDWIASRFTPQAIKQGLAILAIKQQKGELHNPFANRYLVKVTQSQQNELDLNQLEQELLKYAKLEKQHWLTEWENDFQELRMASLKQNEDQYHFVCQLVESTLFSSIFLQKAFWQDKLIMILHKYKHLFQDARNHIKRLYEADPNDRFQLISLLVQSEAGLV